MPAREPARTGQQIRRLSPAIGAELLGIDLAATDVDTARAHIHRALLQHGVIFLRRQALTPARLAALARGFGPLITHPMMRGLPGQEEVLEIVKNPDDRNNFGGSWHTDLSYLKRPAMASMLYAVEVPELGGDTLFANMTLAYDALSDGLKALLAPLRAVHSTTLVYTDTAQDSDGVIGSAASMQRLRRAHSEVLHPVVRTHPETGRKALYVNRDFTVRFEDMSPAESAGLLGYLFEYLQQPEFTCRFRWSPGTLAIWDNRCTQHRALNDYHGHRRVMHRVAIEGDRPL